MTPRPDRSGRRTQIHDVARVDARSGGPALVAGSGLPAAAAGPALRGTPASRPHRLRGRSGLAPGPPVGSGTATHYGPRPHCFFAHPAPPHRRRKQHPAPVGLRSQSWPSPSVRRRPCALPPDPAQSLRCFAGPSRLRPPALGPPHLRLQPLRRSRRTGHLRSRQGRRGNGLAAPGRGRAVGARIGVVGRSGWAR